MKKFIMLLFVTAVLVFFAGCFSSDDNSDEKTYTVSFTLVAYGQSQAVSFSDYWIFELETFRTPAYVGTWYGSGEDYLEIELPDNCKAGDVYSFPGDVINFNVKYMGRTGTIIGLSGDNKFEIKITEKNDSFISGTFSGDINGTYGSLSGVYTIKDGVFNGDYIPEE